MWISGTTFLSLLESRQTRALQIKILAVSTFFLILMGSLSCKYFIIRHFNAVRPRFGMGGKEEDKEPDIHAARYVANVIIGYIHACWVCYA